MRPFLIDRQHPPRSLVHRGADRTIELRPWTFDDIDEMLAAIEESRPSLRRFLPWAHSSADRLTQFELVKRFTADYWAGEHYVFGIFSDTGKVLGGAGLHPRTSLNPLGLEVGYWCRDAHARTGVVTLAVKMMAVLAFDHFGCDRLQVMHDEANAASRRVIEKCGFAFEGTLRNATARVDLELVNQGYCGTGRQRLYAICPEDIVELPWFAEVRARLEVRHALE